MPPKILPFSFGIDPMNYGDSSSVQCNVFSGDFPLEIKWYFNSRRVFDDSIVITDIGKRLKVLSIDSVNARHAGNYTCRASNEGGVDSYTAELFVNGIFCRNIKICPIHFPKKIF